MGYNRRGFPPMYLTMAENFFHCWIQPKRFSFVVDCKRRTISRCLKTFLPQRSIVSHTAKESCLLYLSP
jgi:hypothetical protein